jgi:hypothetical protein
LKILTKLLIVLVVLGGLGYLFVQSLHSTRSAPYSVAAGHLRGWTLALDPPDSGSGVFLALRPPSRLPPALFKQVFERAMESLSAPGVPGMPLLLRQEFEQAFAGRVTAEQLLEAARAAGLESAALEPVCLAHRRISEPGVSRQLYYAVFTSAAFAMFRQRAAALLDAAGSGRDRFDPGSLTPMLFVGASDAAFARWLPLRTDPARDCLAPIVAAP